MQDGKLHRVRILYLSSEDDLFDNCPLIFVLEYLMNRVRYQLVFGDDSKALEGLVILH